MTLAQSLVERGLRTVVILDDAYDAVPRAEDLSDEADAWSIFLDDLSEHGAVIEAAFPDYVRLGVDELRQSDDFVAAIWGLRGDLPKELWVPLFESYEQGHKTDREFLDRLENELKALGLELRTAGREAPVPKDAAIVFVDLFLGAAQQDPDMERSLDRLRHLLDGRSRNPPIVILMSRSDLLSDKKAQFRDEAGLLGTMFRVYSKRDLLNGSNLERTLERLVLHYPDALRVAEFIAAWDEGLQAAAGRFMKVVRRLDLPDYAKIRDVLLEFEGEPLGSYLLDVFDRVLQHETEADAATIRAAAALNAIDTSSYPAPYIAGSADLQELVYRTIWQHPQRLEVQASVDGAPVAFGDVLIRKTVLDNPGAPPAADDDRPEALIVLTASCDLVRGGAKRVLLMAGQLESLTSKTWTYKGSALRTPILELTSERRVWIEWDGKNVRAMLPDEVRGMVAAAGDYTIHHRIRESYALELQQRLFADMGRVGVLAPMPATFPVTIELETVNEKGELVSVDSPVAQRDGGVCFTGRDAKGDESVRLVVTEELVDEMQRVISELDEAAVFAKARDALRSLKASNLVSLVQAGLPAPSARTQSWRPLQAEVIDGSGKPSRVTVGLIARNPEESATPLKQAALVITLRDIEVEAAAAIALVAAQDGGGTDKGPDDK